MNKINIKLLNFILWCIAISIVGPIIIALLILLGFITGILTYN